MLSLGPVDAHKDDKPNIETGQAEWPLKNKPNAKKSQINFFILPSQKVNLFIEFSIRQLHKKVSNFPALDRKIFCGSACFFR